MTLHMKAAGCAVVCSIFVGCGANDYVESRYDDLAAARAAGAVASGWIPSFLPSSATAIRETHNLDTNEVWVTFSAAREVVDGVEACEHSSRGEVVLPRKARLTRWPDVLSEGSGGGQSTPSSYVFYRCGTTAFVAVDEANAKGFFWRRGK